MIDLAVNPYAVIVETSTNALYTYQRIMSPLNYMLGALVVSNKNYLLSPYSNILYILDEKQYDLYELGSGALTLSTFPKSENLTIVAKSTTAQCKFTLSIIKLESTDKILTKKNISKQHFIAQNENTLSIDMEDAFSGQNLRYKVPSSTEDVNFSFEHLTEFSADSELTDARLKQVVSLNKTSYLLLGLWESKVYL